MRWLLKRALLLWLALIALCAAGVGIGKLDRTPDALQTLGFDLCDGEPCFRGIKPGMDWAKVRKQFPDAVVDQSFLRFSINGLGIDSVNIYPSDDQATVWAISIEPADSGLIPISAGESLARYGPPCRIILNCGDTGSICLPYSVIMVYPKHIIEAVINDSINPPTYRLEPSSSVHRFSITTAVESYFGGCNASVTESNGIWHGFTSAEVYYRFNGVPSTTIELIKRR